MASALHYVDTADGVGVSLHVAWTVLTTGGTMISWNYFIYFYGGIQLNCVGIGTVSLLEHLH